MSATTTAARKSSSAFLARGLTVSRSFQVRNRTGRGYPYSNLSYLSSTRRTSSSSSFSTSSSTSYSSSPPPTETSDTTTTKTATRPTIPGNGKISAVPFAFGPEAARERTYLAGLLASGKWGFRSCGSFSFPFFFFWLLLPGKRHVYVLRSISCFFYFHLPSSLLIVTRLTSPIQLISLYHPIPPITTTIITITTTKTYSTSLQPNLRNRLPLLRILGNLLSPRILRSRKHPPS